MVVDYSLVLSLSSGIIVVLATVVLTKRLLRSAPPKTLCNRDTKYSLKLSQKKILNHDTRIFRFDLPSESHMLGLPIGQHIFLSATIDGKLIIRPYTPVSCDDNLGFMELLIKVYFKNTHPKFPEGGKMTQYLDNLKVGDFIDVRGPNGLLIYEGNGKFIIHEKKMSPAKELKYKKICMIAGGSGITPMYQILSHILKSKNDKTEIWLIFANQTEDDILLREQLDYLTKRNENKFNLWYTIDRPSPGWKHGVGFVNKEMFLSHLCPPGNDVLVLMCGPPPMIQFACIPALDQLGYAQEHRFNF